MVQQRDPAYFLDRSSLACGVGSGSVLASSGISIARHAVVCVLRRYALAPARAYVECIDELFHLREEGYLRAGAENLFLVANGDKW